MTRGRVVGLVLTLLVLVVLYTAWQAFETERALAKAQRSVDALTAALGSDDPQARAAAISDLKDAASSAHSHSDGWWFGALTHLPFVGGDVTGVRALSSSLDVVARDGVGPLSTSLDGLDHVSANGRIDLGTVDAVQKPVAASASAFARAAAEVDGLDSSGYVGALRGRFDHYRTTVDDAARGLHEAEIATRALPSMAGADGPRNYLLVFQNNAEIRATGGVPGSWALVHADHGVLTMVRQGSDGDFPYAPKPVVPVTPAESTVYDGPTLAQYFQDPGFTPDFPRSAQIFDGFWAKKFPGVKLDGVVSLDPVAMSYLLEGTGPIDVDSVQLTSQNLVEDLVNKAYVNLSPTQADVFFQHVARTLFDAVTGHLASPYRFVRGMSRAGQEGRFLVAPFDQPEKALLAGRPVLGALSGDDGHVPHVDVGLNDATGAKMSFYLRYATSVTSRSCHAGVQSLAGTMRLSQAISPVDARPLPSYLTGGGTYGTTPGDQVLAVRLYAPYGGTVDTKGIKIDGVPVVGYTSELDGRPVTTVTVQLSGKPVTLTWSMTTGPGQTASGRVGQTPSIVPGDGDSTFASSC